MKHFSKLLLFLLFLGILLAGIACRGIPLKSVCDTIVDPSVLCDMSANLGMRLEEVGNVLIIANAVAIGQGLYTKGEALDVMVELLKILDNPVSYVYFWLQLDQAITDYPGLIEVQESYFEEFRQNSRIMYNTDREILVGFLANQIGILSRASSGPE